MKLLTFALCSVLLFGSNLYIGNIDDTNTAVSEEADGDIGFNQLGYGQSDDYEGIDPFPFDEKIDFLVEQKVAEIAENKTAELIDKYRIIACSTGDLNGDSLSDLAVVAEQLSSGQLGSRKLYVLLQKKDGSYYVDCSNERLIFGRMEGGVFGEPFESITIRNLELLINHFGGSGSRWGCEDTFKYIDNELCLTKSVEEIHYNGNATERMVLKCIYDYTGGCVEISEANIALYLSSFPITAHKFTEIDIEEMKQYNYEKIAALPTYQSSNDRVDEKKIHIPKISTNEALDIVKEKYYPDLKKEYFDWTEETKKNYSNLVSYEVPDYYYKNGDAILYLNDCNNAFNSDDIYYRGLDEFESYTINSSTGEIIQ